MFRRMLIGVVVAVLASLVGCSSTAQFTVRANWRGIPLEFSVRP